MQVLGAKNEYRLVWQGRHAVVQYYLYSYLGRSSSFEAWQFATLGFAYVFGSRGSKVIGL